MLYKRILLKLSGESMGGQKGIGFDTDSINSFAKEIAQLVHLKTEVAVVLGGGNIFRGISGLDQGVNRTQGDYMGMMATIINSMALQSALNILNIDSEILSGLKVDRLVEYMTGQKAIKLLKQGKVVIMAGGTGNPYFTTDSAAALRAVEIQADALLKGTRVDGIYTADPEKDPKATKYDSITFDDAYRDKLKIMDLTAFTLCKENKMPIVVFNINESGSLKKIISGEKVGTLVHD